MKCQKCKTKGPDLYCTIGEMTRCYPCLKQNKRLHARFTKAFKEGRVKFKVTPCKVKK